jgi:hypothetical protein
VCCIPALPTPTCAPLTYAVTTMDLHGVSFFCWRRCL